MRTSSLLLLAFPLTGCLFGGCPEDIPEAESECLDGGSSAPSIEIVDEDGRALADGAELQLDYGNQGGQHIYLNLIVSGFQDRFIEATFESDAGTTSSMFVFVEEDCEAAARITGEIFQLSDSGTGTLRVAIVECDGSCSPEDPANKTVIAEDALTIDVLP